jgi:hypothetical protein
LAKKASGRGATASDSSEFHVSLRGLNLKPDVEKRIETAIRRVVLEEVAKIDNQGDLHIVPLERFPSAIGGPHGGTMGIVAEAVSAATPRSGVVVLYGVPIRDAIRRGNLAEMKRLAAQATDLLEKEGDLKEALAELKRAIARAGG